jgi:hypothetical protein
VFTSVRSKNFWRRTRKRAAGPLLLLWPLLASAQNDAVLKVRSPAAVRAGRGQLAAATITVEVRQGYHVNSHAPAEPYLIPLRLSWKSGPLEPVETVYPKPKLARFPFASKPLSVFDGAFVVTVRFRVPASAPLGPGQMTGKLRYQACNDTACLPPNTAEIRVPFTVHP